MSHSYLIVLMGSLGDVVRALPLAALLKASEPDCRIGWVVDSRWRDLLRIHSAIDRTLVFERRRPLTIIGRLRAERWHVCLDLQRILKSGVLSWLSGAQRRIGFHPRDAKEQNSIFNNEFIPAMGTGVSKIAHYLEFAKHLGLALPVRLDFGLGEVKPTALLEPSTLDKRAHIVALIMGSSRPAKDWPSNRYRDLARMLIERSSARIVLLGNPEKRAMASEIAASLPGNRTINLVARTSLLDLVDALKQATIAVGPDSGPGHLAAALGTPYIGLFGPTDPRRVAPYHCERLAITSPTPCECRGRRCRRRGGSCMSDITAEVVWGRIESVMTGLSP